MGVFFESLTLEPREEMRAIYHRHGMVLFTRLVPYAIAMVALFLFLFPLFSLGVRGVVAFIVVCVFCIVFSLRAIVAWLGTVTMLTNSRLLLVERRGFFKTRVSEMKLDQIFKVSYEMKGMRQTLGRYGTLVLVVMLSGENMYIHDIPNPQEALNQISRAVSEVMKAEQSGVGQRRSAHRAAEDQPAFRITERTDP